MMKNERSRREQEKVKKKRKKEANRKREINKKVKKIEKIKERKKKIRWQSINIVNQADSTLFLRKQYVPEKSE